MTHLDEFGWPVLNPSSPAPEQPQRQPRYYLDYACWPEYYLRPSTEEVRPLAQLKTHPRAWQPEAEREQERADVGLERHVFIGESSLHQATICEYPGCAALYGDRIHQTEKTNRWTGEADHSNKDWRRLETFGEPNHGIRKPEDQPFVEIRTSGETIRLWNKFTPRVVRQDTERRRRQRQRLKPQWLHRDPETRTTRVQERKLSLITRKRRVTQISLDGRFRRSRWYEDTHIRVLDLA